MSTIIQITKYPALVLMIGLTVLSCRKEDDMMDGPSLEDIYGPWFIVNDLQASKDSVNFSTGEYVHFTAEFSKTVSWNLSILGLSTGAEKIVEGTSKYIDASQFLWNGSTTNLPMFKEEVCKVQLTFDTEVDTLTDTLVVTQPKVNNGLWSEDFENGWNGGWGSFIQTGAMMDFQVKTDGFAAESDGYLNMQGEVSWDWLIGLVNFNATAYGETHFPLTTNADNVYFNALVYGESGFPNSLVLFQFDEDDNGNDSFDAASEDRFIHEVWVDWVGWRLISVKYSDLVDEGANGNDIPEPDKLSVINMLHLADPNSGLAKSKLDYLIFTTNGPFVP